MLIFLQIAAWLGIYLGLGYLGLPLSNALLGRSEERATGIARLLALVLWMALYWIGPLLFPINPGPFWAALTLLAVTGLAVWIQVRTGDRGEVELFSVRTWIEPGFFVGVFLSALWVQSWQSAVIEPDQYMSFMVFDTLLQAESFPPPDTWFAGEALNYYYLSYLLFVPVARLASIPTEYALSLMQAMSMSLIFGVLYTFAVQERMGRGMAMALASLGTWGSTLATSFLLLKRGSDFFWREPGVIIRGSTSNETPLFTFLVGDQHAHFTSLSVTILTAIVLVAWVRAFPKRSMALAGVAGALCALHQGLNGWSVPPLFALAGVAWIVNGYRHRKAGMWKEAGQALAAFGGTALLVLVSVMWHHTMPPVSLAWVEPQWRSDLFGFSLHWFFLLFPFAVLGILRNVELDDRMRWGVGVVAMLLTPFFGVVAGGLVLLLGSYLFSFVRGKEGPGVGEFLVVTSLAVLLGCEFVFIQDPGLDLPFPRTNTTFKFHFVVYALLLTAVPLYWNRWTPFTRKAWGFSLPLAFLLLPATLLTRDLQGNASLDGLAWFRSSLPNETKAVNWLRTNTPPSTTIVEAVRPIFVPRGYTSIATFSKRATLLGPLGHVMQQRAHQKADVVQRLRDIEEIYSTRDPSRLKALLKQRNVSIVFLGHREQETYEIEASAAVRALPVLFQSGEVTLYSAQ